MYVIEEIGKQIAIVDTTDGVVEWYSRKDVQKFVDMGIPIWNLKYLYNEEETKSKLAKLTLLADKNYDIEVGSYGEIQVSTNTINPRFPKGVDSVIFTKYLEQRLERIIIPDGVDCINLNVASCHNLTEIRLPNNKYRTRQFNIYNCGVSSLDLSNYCGCLDAVHGCKNLTKVTLGDGIDCLGAWEGHPNLFRDCPLEELIIPKSVKLIQNLDLCACKFETLYVPPNVKKIGNIHTIGKVLCKRGTLIDMKHHLLSCIRYYD